MLGAALVGAVVLFATLGPVFAGHDPLRSDFVAGFDPITGLPAAPSWTHKLGTDRLFRDELARLAFGARLSLVIGIASTALAIAIGTCVGILSGWFQGEPPRVPASAIVFSVAAGAAVVMERPRLAAALAVVAIAAWVAGIMRPGSAWAFGPRIDVDGVLMRAVDVGLSFPFLLLVMAIGAALERTSVTTIFLVLGFTGWLGTARIVRARTMSLRRLEFVEAARALGQNTSRILLSHVLPNVAGPIVVIATAQVAQMILAESVLAYLGAGVTPPTPTWGGMLSEAQDYLGVTPWLVLAPAFAILVTVLGFNLMGEGLRDALDPKSAARPERAARVEP